MLAFTALRKQESEEDASWTEEPLILMVDSLLNFSSRSRVSAAALGAERVRLQNFVHPCDVVRVVNAVKLAFSGVTQHLARVHMYLGSELKRSVISMDVTILAAQEDRQSLPKPLWVVISGPSREVSESVPAQLERPAQQELCATAAGGGSMTSLIPAPGHGVSAGFPSAQEVDLMAALLTPRLTTPELASDGSVLSISPGVSQQSRNAQSVPGAVEEPCSLIAERNFVEEGPAIDADPDDLGEVGRPEEDFSHMHSNRVVSVSHAGGPPHDVEENHQEVVLVQAWLQRAAILLDEPSLDDGLPNVNGEEEPISNFPSSRDSSAPAYVNSEGRLSDDANQHSSSTPLPSMSSLAYSARSSSSMKEPPSGQSTPTRQGLLPQVEPMQIAIPQQVQPRKNPTVDSDMNTVIVWEKEGYRCTNCSRPPLLPGTKSTVAQEAARNLAARSASRRKKLRRADRLTLLQDVWTLVRSCEQNANDWLLRLSFAGNQCTDNEGNKWPVVFQKNKMYLLGGLLTFEGENLLHRDGRSGARFTFTRGDGGKKLGAPLVASCISDALAAPLQACTPSGSEAVGGECASEGSGEDDEDDVSCSSENQWTPDCDALASEREA